MKQINNEKVIHFNEYLKKCERIESNFKEQIEAEIITLDEVRAKKAEMTKKLEKLVLEIHPYSISQMTGKDKRWTTTVYINGTRKIIKKNTYEDVMDYLIGHYKVGTKKITLRTIYPLWINYKANSTIKMASIQRISHDWRYYYENDPIVDIPLEQMTTHTIGNWLNNKIIKEGFSAKKKAFYNMITIFKGIFIYCYEEGLIPTNTFERTRYRRDLLESKPKPKAETQVFNQKEKIKLLTAAYNGFEKNPTLTSYLAIPLLFQTGMRCGELVALKETDYDKKKKKLSITSSEIRDYELNDDGVVVPLGKKVAAPKTNSAKRTITLTDEACFIIETIMEANRKNGFKDDDYLFVFKNKRMNSGAVLERMYDLCDKAGIPRRSPHKARKTVFSEMLHTCLKDDICDISAIREVAGHVDENTLLKNYIFSTKGDEIGDLMDKALGTETWKQLETKRKI